MAIDHIQANQVNTELARRLAAKQTELKIAENSLNLEKQKIESKGQQNIQESIDRNEKNIVNLSKEGEQAAERIKKQHLTRTKDLDEKNQSHFTKLSQETAERMKALDIEMAKQLSSHQLKTLEKLTTVENRSEDPFYRLKSFDANLSEDDLSYKLTIKLPAHEAQNLFVTANGRDLKLSLARSYEASNTLEDGRSNRTNSYQTILENITLPTKVDSNGSTRNYTDGLLTIRLPKNI